MYNVFVSIWVKNILFVHFSGFFLYTYSSNKIDLGIYLKNESNKFRYFTIFIDFLILILIFIFIDFKFTKVS